VSKKVTWRDASAASVASKSSKTVVIGLSKTGTSTLHHMLATLGYRVCGPRKDLLARVRSGEMFAIDDTLDAYDAFEDWPWPLTYRHVLERYGENAKFILTVRESSDRWLASVISHGLRTDPTKSMRLAYNYYRPFGRERQFEEMYEQHNDEVRSFFAAYPGQFIEFCLETGDGWEKLCGFLNEPVPALPVPHANRTSAREKRLNVMVNRMIAPIYSRLVRATS
jgi:Sulfotransferase domain